MSGCTAKTTDTLFAGRSPPKVGPMEIRPGPAALMAGMLVAAAVLPPLALFLLATGVVIAIHETAHAVVAKTCGVTIEAAGLGFGPLVARLSVRGLPLELRAIPAGGYVAIAGMTTPGPRTFAAASRRARAAVLAAGSFANLAAGTLLLFAAPLVAGASPARAVAAASEIALLMGGGTIEAMARPLLTLDPIAAPIAGPFCVAAVLSQSAGSPAMFLVAMATLSTGIGIANLLPLPLIDGGRLVDLLRDRPGPTGRRAALPAVVLVVAGIGIDLLRMAAAHPYAPHF